METSTLYHLFQQHRLVTTDSRNCPKGSIFFALKGENFNGNAFATKALEAGCAYAVIDEANYAVADDKRYILVNNVLKALQDLANYHRRQLGTRVIGITGTNGKTTTKELVATVLSQVHHVLYTEGNLNNSIGVPLTLLRLTAEHDIAVIEMGASHPGDIKELVEIAEPDFGLITNVGMAHLQGFGSLEGVIRTKGELYDYLRTKPESTIFINNDNEHLKQIAGDLNKIFYGKPDAKNALHISGEVIDCAPYLHFRWHMSNASWYEVQTHLIGSYNIDNMMAAATIGLYFGVTPAQINKALSEYIPQNNRSQLQHTSRNRLIIDAYNANPTSMMAALKNFRDMDVTPKMAILGDMKELGECSLNEHRKVVAFLDEAGIDTVWLVGDQFSATATSDKHRTFSHVNEVIEAIQKEDISDFYILIKGSNSMKLAQTVPHL
ncbi:MAG: UDP-N-acetylmuramoyl-tripeptide--D-alanyl-D-alanine ligase [Bacteroidaceae bacterium]|nr:UDP-N-acetylmuramoyl-tripeptide--D-alanyl-D-alanine ligase [Bacteroidaceae bacterium]